MTAPTDAAPSYQDQLADIAQLPDEALPDLYTQAAEAFEEADEANDLGSMQSAADALDQIVAEAQKRGVDLTVSTDEEPADMPAESPVPVTAAVAEATVEPEATEAEPVEPSAADDDATSEPATETAEAGPESDETPPEEPPVAEAAEVSSDEPETDEEPPLTEETEETQTETADASAAAENLEEAKVDTPSVPEDRQPLATPVAAPNVVTAGGDVAGVSAGSIFESRQQFNQAMVDKIAALENAEGRGEHALVARVKHEVPDDRTLHAGDFQGNLDKIAEVVGRDANHVKALVASGGYCAPLESRYDVFGVGVTDRPVRGALPGFRAQRGGIRFIAPPSLAGVTGSTGVWTAATDASPGVKNKLIVACGSEQTVSISAITLEMQFGNFIARAYPEMVERNVELGLIAQARLAEQTLLSSIGTLSTAVTSSAVLGTARDLLVTVARAASGYRSRHRMAADSPLRALIPAWVRDAIREDVAFSQTPTTDNVLGYSGQDIEGWLSARNVSVSWHLDDSSFYTAQAAGAVADFPATIVWNLFAEGTFLFLDGGTLDIGIVRDSTLVGTNDYIQFTENFEAVAKVGVEALKVTSTTHVKGSVSGPVTVS